MLDAMKCRMKQKTEGNCYRTRTRGDERNRERKIQMKITFSMSAEMHGGWKGGKTNHDWNSWKFNLNLKILRHAIEWENYLKGPIPSLFNFYAHNFQLNFNNNWHGSISLNLISWLICCAQRKAKQISQLSWSSTRNFIALNIIIFTIYVQTHIWSTYYNYEWVMWCESNFPCYGINSVLFNHMNNMPENKIQPSVIFYFVHRALETRLERNGKGKLRTRQLHSCHKLMPPLASRLWKTRGISFYA